MEISPTYIKRKEQGTKHRHSTIPLTFKAGTYIFMFLYTKIICGIVQDK